MASSSHQAVPADWNNRTIVGARLRIIDVRRSDPGSWPCGSKTNHRVSLAHLDRLESPRVVHRPRAAEMARVTGFGVVTRIALDPGRTAGRPIGNHPVEQRRGNAVAPERRRDEEAGDADH